MGFSVVVHTHPTRRLSKSLAGITPFGNLEMSQPARVLVARSSCVSNIPLSKIPPHLTFYLARFAWNQNKSPIIDSQKSRGRVVLLYTIMYLSWNIFACLLLLTAVVPDAENGAPPADKHEFLQSSYYNDTVYNLGDLFNMPSYSTQWSSSWPKMQRSARTLDQAQKLAIQNNQSLLALYFRDNSDSLSPDARYPNLSRIALAVQEFGKQHIANHASAHSFAVLRKNTTLLVHVRSGDIGHIHPDFVQCVLNISARFNMTILMGGVHVHSNKQWYPKDIALNNIAMEMHHLVRECHKMGISAFIHYGKNPDADLYMMSIASNLLLHRGGYSALGGLLNKGNTFFYTDMEQFLSTPEYYQYLHSPNRGCLGPPLPAALPAALAHSTKTDCVTTIDNDLFENVSHSLRARQKWSRDLAFTLEEAYDGYLKTSKLKEPSDPRRCDVVFNNKRMTSRPVTQCPRPASSLGGHTGVPALPLIAIMALLLLLLLFLWVLFLWVLLPEEGRGQAYFEAGRQSRR